MVQFFIRRWYHDRPRCPVFRSVHWNRFYANDYHDPVGGYCIFYYLGGIDHPSSPEIGYGEGSASGVFYSGVRAVGWHSEAQEPLGSLTEGVIIHARHQRIAMDGVLFSVETLWVYGARTMSILEVEEYSVSPTLEAPLIVYCVT